MIFPKPCGSPDWQRLAHRYANNSTVIGFDLRNELHNANSGGSCWSGCDAAHDWHLPASVFRPQPADSVEHEAQEPQPRVAHLGAAGDGDM
jgi:hypothetical protein